MKNKKGRWALIGIKIDMDKAYDKLKWELIIQVMKRLGFSERFCNLIKRCLYTVSHSILLNGSKQDFTRPLRGLRQRDH